MVERSRSEYDGDLPNKLHQVNLYKSENYQHEIRCSLCGGLYFVDSEIFKKIEKQMKYDLDNQFLCENCEREYKDAAFE